MRLTFTVAFAVLLIPVGSVTAWYNVMDHDIRIPSIAFPRRITIGILGTFTCGAVFTTPQIEGTKYEVAKPGNNVRGAEWRVWRGRNRRHEAAITFTDLREYCG